LDTFVRRAVNDQIIERIALILSLKLQPFNPGIGESARFAAGEHLQEVKGA
jgi:hypothetical protein